MVTDSIDTVMDDIYVHAPRLSSEVSSTAPTQQMSRSQLSAIAAHTAADAIRHFAGTTLKDYGGIGGLKTVSVRGLGATHTAVSYDDAVVGNCQAGQIDLGRFASSSMGSIALHVGQSDELMTTARALASGSLVSMSSHIPQWSTRPYRLEAKVMGGSFGLFNPYILYAHKLGEQTWSSTSLDLSTAHGRYPYTLTNGNKVSTEQRTNTDITQLLGEWNLHHRFTDGSQLHTKLYAYSSERGLPGAVILYNAASKERLADRNLFVQARYTRHWDTRWQLRAIAKYTYGWNRYTDTNVKYLDGKQEDINLQNEYYAQATLLYRPTLAWSFSLAQDGYASTLTSNLPSCPLPVRYTSLTALQAQYRTHRINVRGILLGTIVDETFRKSHETISSTDNEALSAQELTPTLSTSIRPFGNTPLFVRMMYKKTFRMPTFNDLYYFRSGNKNLRPERAHEYNAGISWQAQLKGAVEELTLTADGYFNDVTDKIVAFPTTYVWKMANYGHVHITGIDATCHLRWRLTADSKLHVSSSYTLQHAVDVTNPEASNYRMQLPYTPLHSGSARLLLTTPWVNVGYSLIASSERYSTSEQLPRYRIGSYAEHTITLSRRFTLHGTSLTAQAEALNLTNATYEVIQYYPMPGRQFRLSLTITL